MRNSVKFFLTSLIIFLFTSCSFMIKDLQNCSKGSQYIVEHYQEIVAEYNKTETGFEQSNLVPDEGGNLVPAYELFEKEFLHGTPESLTNAVAKAYQGFTAQSFDQESINEDGSTVIKIYYNRNEVSITVCIGDGLWNYAQTKLDSSIIEDNENKTFTKKYGSSTEADFSDLFESAGKKSCVLTKYLLDDGSQTSVLPEIYPPENKVYTAIWEEGKPANYKVVYHFEKLDCIDNSIESDENYEIKSDLTVVKTGAPEDETETQENVLTIHGFTAKPHSEQEIAATGSTIVNIYYVRNPYSITISTDEGLWNYDEWKADKANVSQITSPKIYDGKFETKIDWSFLSSLKKTGMNLVALKNDVTGEVVKLDKLPSTIPAMSLSYTAQWSKKSPVAYEVKFMTEKVNSTDSDDVNNYTLNSYDRSLSGTPEYYTEAVAKEISGFTAKEINQEEIKEDGTTEVFVYYTRNSYKITFDLNGGYWNYIDYRNDKTITPDSTLKEIVGKFEDDVVIPDFSKMGKRANDFNCWKNLSDGKEYSSEELNQVIQKIPSSNVVLQAQWTKGSGFEYTIEHWFEKVDSKDSSNTSNYELREDLTQKELGEEIGDDTEAVAKVIEGFTSKPFTQKKITGDGNTKIVIYYTRNISRFIFELDGGLISEGQSEISGKYGMTFDADSTPKATKSGWTFGGWKYNGKLVTDSDMKINDFVFDTEDKLFHAYWVSMISVKTLTTFGDINLVKVQDSHNVTCSIELPSGYDSQSWNYKWYVDDVYSSDETIFSRTTEVLGKGVHTITVKATMNGQNFTQRVTATID